MREARRREWFDDDSFWRDLYLFMFPKKRLAAGAEEMRQALRLMRPKGRRALDLCCGPGRCAVPLAKKGFAVTGVDRTRYLLNKARARARAARAKVEWIEQDMRDFVRPESFDLAVIMFTSFGFFAKEEDDLRVLRNVFVSLRPGGAFLVDVIGKERLAKIFLKTSSDDLPGGVRLVQRHQIIDDWTRIRNEWILIRGGRAKTFKFDLRLYSGRELKDRMEQIGFKGVKLYGDLDGRKYGLDSQRLIAVGWKGGRTRRT